MNRRNVRQFAAAAVAAAAIVLAVRVAGDVVERAAGAVCDGFPQSYARVSDMGSTASLLPWTAAARLCTTD